MPISILLVTDVSFFLEVPTSVLLVNDVQFFLEVPICFLLVKDVCRPSNERKAGGWWDVCDIFSVCL